MFQIAQEPPEQGKNDDTVFMIWFTGLPGSVNVVSFCSCGFENPNLDFAVLKE